MTASVPTRNKRFRVGLSFSGSVRSTVNAVADELAQVFTTEAILYDKYHEAEFARGDLALYLPPLYREQCDLIVAIVDPSYLEKDWTGLEWRAIYSLFKSKQFDQVMLLSLGTSSGTGLFDLDGPANIFGRSPQDIAILILERLAINEGLTRTYYTSQRTSWQLDQIEAQDSKRAVSRIADELSHELSTAISERSGRSRRRSLLAVARKIEGTTASSVKLLELRITAWKRILLESRFHNEYKSAIEQLQAAFDSALQKPSSKDEKWHVVRVICETAVDITQTAPTAIELNKLVSQITTAIKELSSLLGLHPTVDHSPSRHSELLATRSKCKRALATLLSRRSHRTQQSVNQLKALRAAALQDATRCAALIQSEFTLFEKALALLANASSANSESAKEAFAILQDLAGDARNVLATYEYVRQLNFRHHHVSAIKFFYPIVDHEQDKRRFHANLGQFARSIIGLHYSGTNAELATAAAVQAINWLQEAISVGHHRATEIVHFCYMMAIAGYPIEKFVAPLQEIRNGDAVDWNVIAQLAFHAAAGEETLREALLLGLEDAGVWGRMGTLYVHFARDSEQAIVFYDQAIRLEPGNPVYHYNRARVLTHGLKKYPEAKQSLNQVRRLAKNSWGWFKANEPEIAKLEAEIWGLQ